MIDYMQKSVNRKKYEESEWKRKEDIYIYIYMYITKKEAINNI